MNEKQPNKCNNVLAPKRPSGRLISETERKQAGESLDKYEAALSSPEGYFCPNPDAPEEEQQRLYASQVLGYALNDLRRIRDHGTLFFVEVDTDKWFIRMEVAALRATGLSYEKAIETVAEKHPIGERTIRRIVDKAKS